MQPFTRAVIEIIQGIPSGRVLTYGYIAALAGNPGAARQVSRILHAMSDKYGLPWHRVINSKGKISLLPSGGYEIQKSRLESEGICFDKKDQVDLETYLWDIPSVEPV